jgi:hypothetical protein
MDYLRSIEHMQLPFRITDVAAIQYIHVLHAAGLVDVKMVLCPATGIDKAADVLAITPKGRVALAHHAQGRPFS